MVIFAVENVSDYEDRITRKGLYPYPQFLQANLLTRGTGPRKKLLVGDAKREYLGSITYSREHDDPRHRS